LAALIMLAVAMAVSWRAVDAAAPEEWEKTLAAAKTEGQVNVYIGGWGAVLDEGLFQKRFPEIKVVAVAQRKGGEIARRILAERRAGKYVADVSIEGFNSNYNTLHAAKVFDPLKPALMLPEVVDESKWWRGKLSYLDPEGRYVLRFAGVPQTGGVHYNSQLVNPKEFTSFWDFLNPKWKGKIEARDARVPGPGNGALRFFYHTPELGPQFIRRLFGETDITLFRDFRQGPDWLATGKFAICFFCSDIPKMKKQGLPVDGFGAMKEGAGLVSQYGTIGFVNNAPHPNAAKVFINWFLSRDGQMTLQRALSKATDEAPDSLRIDIPKDDVPVEDRRVEGVNYLDLDVPGRLDMKPIVAVIEEALAGRK
jgi:iron(III) transport system substrate-binding protein